MAQVRRFETLNKENYDTWKMFMEALLVKNDMWQYVNGTKVKPEIQVGVPESVNAARTWEQVDAKARSDIVLSINASELKQIKGCTTSRETWLRLEAVYQSKGPARKAALLRQLITSKMHTDSDVHEHLRHFFDIVDKINEIGVEVDQDLLSTLLLISLSKEFDNFRCAIESRDALPSLEVLRVKISEEADARKSVVHDSTSNAMLAGKRYRKPQKKPKNPSENSSSNGCEACLEAKITRSPFPIKSDRTTAVLDLVHTDLCGPMRIPSIGGAKYILHFIDDCSRWGQIYFLKSKSDVFQALKEYVVMIENQTGKKIKCIQSDNGKKFVNSDIDGFLKERGIVRRLTVPYSPQQNGVAERRNRTIVEMARCILLESGLPPRFWGEAVNTANYVRNRCPSKSLDGKTFFEALSGKIPDVSHLREFGDHVFVLNNVPGLGKFHPRGIPGIFVGYSDTSKAYRIWIPEKERIIISRDVKFSRKSASTSKGPHEDFRPETTDDDRSEDKNGEPDQNHVDVELKSLNRAANQPMDNVDPERENENAEDVAAPDQEDEEIPLANAPDNANRRRAPGRPKIVRTGSRGRPRKEYHSRPEEAAFSEEQVAFISEVPMKKAMSSPNADEWWTAMVDELKSIIKNDTWDLIERPQDCTIIGSRMVLRNKTNSDGSIQRRKARLVAQGFSQKPGIHFNETFAPVARSGSIRLMASLAARYDMKIFQLDVATAYLNGFLEEDVLMEPLKELKRLLKTIINFEKIDNIRRKAEKMLSEVAAGDKVCKLKKALYGLRQAGRSWYLTFDKVLKEHGVVPTNADTCLYHIGKGENIVLIAVYVDDVLIASRNQEEIDRIITSISKRFTIRNLGEVQQCLGIEFSREGNNITLSQRGYIREILERFGMSDCNPISTPVDPNIKLDKAEKISSSDEEDLPYRELVGCLTYLASFTRPDISFAAGYLGQYNNCFDESHWKAAKRVLRYLKGTMDFGLTYYPNSKPLTGYVDSSWGNCHDDRRSQSGFIFILNGSPITWESRKQSTVALSTCEAEYMALTEGAKEAIFMQRFLKELGFDRLGDITIFGDNLGSIKLAENPVFHQRSKHIDIKYHFIRDAIHHGGLKIQHISTEDTVADVLIKGLPREKHINCLSKAGMRASH
ncbi:unnamed protein product [Lasius platythorax]|uniref:Integrase catalytic domain-containing protein n=1 Tax=Lasius platythorax TaxID=488582 RepID=A0AAV2NL27_9HYME